MFYLNIYNLIVINTLLYMYIAFTYTNKNIRTGDINLEDYNHYM